MATAHDDTGRRLDRAEVRLDHHDDLFREIREELREIHRTLGRLPTQGGLWAAVATMLTLDLATTGLAVALLAGIGTLQRP
jgi:hypothetical protein